MNYKTHISKLALVILLTSAGSTHNAHAESSFIKGVGTGILSAVYGGVEGGVIAPDLEFNLINDMKNNDRSVAKRAILWMPMLFGRATAAFLLSLGNLPGPGNMSPRELRDFANMTHINDRDDMLKTAHKIIEDFNLLAKFNLAWGHDTCFELLRLEFSKNFLLAEVSSWIAYIMTQRNTASRLRKGHSA